MLKPPSNKKLGDFYGLHRNTISNYKKLTEYRKIYEALIMFYNANLGV